MRYSRLEGGTLAPLWKADGITTQVSWRAEMGLDLCWQVEPGPTEFRGVLTAKDVFASFCRPTKGRARAA